MDDFGNIFQTEEWANGCEQFAFSTSVYGMFDDDWCWEYNIQYWQVDI